MKKMFASLLLAICGLAQADMSIVVPNPSGWWTVVIPELQKHLGEKIVPEVISGARDIPSGNKWEEKFKTDNNYMWFSHGGNAESWLIDPATKYNYKDYEPIFAQNQTIVVGYNKNINPFKDGVKFGAGSGMNPDAMAITLMICGELPNMKAYLECYKKNVNYVKSMKTPEIALAYIRGELNVIRQNPFDYNRDFLPMETNVTWFSAGLSDAKTGKIIPDPNYAVGTRSFPEAYKAKWGKEPKGEFYDAWVLVKSYRDVLQKVVWVNKGNPNKDRLIAAARKMIADPESQKIIADKVGTYPWWVGDEVTQARLNLEKQLTKKAVTNLVWWTNEAFQMEAVFKPEIISKAK